MNDPLAELGGEREGVGTFALHCGASYPCRPEFDACTHAGFPSFPAALQALNGATVKARDSKLAKMVLKLSRFFKVTGSEEEGGQEKEAAAAARGRTKQSSSSSSPEKHGPGTKKGRAPRDHTPLPPPPPPPLKKIALKDARAVLRDYLTALRDPLAVAAMAAAMAEAPAGAEEGREEAAGRSTYSRTLEVLTHEVSYEHGFQDSAAADGGFGQALRSAASAGKGDKKVRSLLRELHALTTPPQHRREPGDEDL